MTDNSCQPNSLTASTKHMMSEPQQLSQHSDYATGWITVV